MTDQVQQKSDKTNSRQGVLIVKNGLEIIVMIFVAVIILFSLLSIYGSYFGTGSPVAVTTKSMSPVFGGYDPRGTDSAIDRRYFIPMDGDLLVIKVGKPVLGDTIVYRKNGALEDIPIVHRVIAVQTNSSGISFYLTKGDNNFLTDSSKSGWIEENEVIGIVVLRIPNIGWLSLEIQNETMRLFLIVCLGVLLILMLLEDENIDVSKSSKQEKGKKSTGSSIGSKLKFWKVRNPFRRKSLRKVFRSLFSTQRGNVTIVIIIIFVCFLSLNLWKIGFNQQNSISIQNQRNIETIDTSPLGFKSYFIHFYLDLNSNGIFNWINKIELKVSGSSNSIDYLWKIPYSYSEKLTIKSGFIVSELDFLPNNNYTVNLQYTIYSSGIFAQKPTTQVIPYTFQLN